MIFLYLSYKATLDLFSRQDQQMNSIENHFTFMFFCQNSNPCMYQLPLLKFSMPSDWWLPTNDDRVDVEYFCKCCKSRISSRIKWDGQIGKTVNETQPDRLRLNRISKTVFKIFLDQKSKKI